MCESRRDLAAMVLQQAGGLLLPDGHLLSEAVRARAAALGATHPSATVWVVDARTDGTELVEAVTCWSLDLVPHLRPAGSQAGTLEGDPRLDGAAVVQETSGSTGHGRLVARSPRSLAIEAAGYRDGLNLRAGEVVRVPVPTTHSFGWGVALAGLLASCVVDAKPLVRPRAVSAELDAGEIAVLAVTPAVAATLVETVPTGAGGPRAVLVGAGAIPAGLDAALEARFRVRAIRGYGSTETGGRCSDQRASADPSTA